MLEQLSEETLRGALEELPEEFRVAVVLCDLFDFSYREIADIVGCPVGTVMSQLYRGRRQLQKKLYRYALERGLVGPPAEERQGPAPADLSAYRDRKKRRGER